MTAAEVVALRKAVKCTQKDFAARLKVEVAVVQGWEAGTLFPTLKHVKMLGALKSVAESVAVAGAGTNTSTGTTTSTSRSTGTDAAFIAALRKALANPELQAELIRAAARYKDPLDH
ncbi:MAG: hypothetical protein HYY84_09945 [Deltaproteobacteria bacterium]|nr:hypothetical protein [Deltaproteobacteria bacterium]